MTSTEIASQLNTRVASNVGVALDVGYSVLGVLLFLFCVVTFVRKM